MSKRGKEDEGSQCSQMLLTPGGPATFSKGGGALLAEIIIACKLITRTVLLDALRTLTAFDTGASRHLADLTLTLLCHCDLLRFAFAAFASHCERSPLLRLCQTKWKIV